MITGRDQQRIKQLIDVCTAVAHGDFEARVLDVPESGRMRELMDAINLMIDRTDAYIRESKACLGYVARNQHFRMIVERGLEGAFVEGAQTINKATYTIKQKNDDFAEIASRFEQEMEGIVDTVSGAVEDLKGSSGAVDQASNSAAEQSVVVAAGSEEASANMQNVASATEELTSSIGEINEQVLRASNIASDAVEKAKNMSSMIDTLSGASGRIGEVVNFINAIAAQTNLLALNATIEAARAGEAGRGFAIVAQEVKNLAGQTAQATEEIVSQISDLQNATNGAVAANSNISEAITNVSEISTAIASAVEEQSTATREIARNVNEAAAGTTEISAGISRVRTATDETKQTASDVLVASDKLAEQEEALGALRSEMNTFLAEIRKVG